MTEAQTFTREVKVTVSPQAIRVLSQTKYDVQEFLEWALKTNSISFGGHHVALFLENKANEGR